jgi:RNA polymerase sigma-70 factor (ECF subfamily)
VNSEQSKKTEAEFLGKIFAGDDGAFHSLFAIYNKKLVIFAHKMLGEREAARDLAQEVWIRIIDQRRTKEKVLIENAGAYLFRIARNLCIDKIRSAKEHLPIEELSEKDHPHSFHVERTALEEMVIATLEKLSYDDREILVMHSYLGYAYDEIAEMQSKSPEAVWTRASRARGKMREMIRSEAKREGIEIVENMKVKRGESV